jgi:putative MFS transporter
LKSRRRVLFGLSSASRVLATVAYFTVGPPSLVAFYAMCVVVLGFGAGYWAVFVTVASEQFGTNLRATATTTAPNFVRGAVVLVTSSFQALKGPLGVVGSAALVGVVVLVLGFVSLLGLEETHGKDLDFVEE